MLNKEFFIISTSNNTVKVYVEGNVKFIKSQYAEKIALELERMQSDSFKPSWLTRQILDTLGIKVVKDHGKHTIKNIEIWSKSLNELYDYFKKKNSVVSQSILINLHNYVMLVPKNMCAFCAIRRLVYYAEKIYSHKELWNINPFPINKQSKLEEALIDVVKEKNKNRIVIIEKSSHKIYRDKLINFSDCPICFNNVKHDTSNLKLHNIARSINNENGTRSISNSTAIKKMKQNIGIMHPINSVYQTDKLDRLNMPVFEAKIGIDPLKFDLGFMIHGGKGQTKTQAECSAIGEAVERYNAQFFSNEKIISGSYNDVALKYKCIKPEQFSRDNNISVNRVIDWNLVTCLTDRTKVLVPSNSVYFVYEPEDMDKKFMIQDTTGLSSGVTLEDAILQGLNEVIERDAYSIYCKRQLNAYDINNSTIDDLKLKHLIQKLSANGILVHLKYLKTDISLYVVHCVTEDVKKDFPVYTHGSGASLEPRIAISRAITECIQLRSSQLKLKKYIPRLTSKEYEAYISWGKGDKSKVANLLNPWKSISYTNMPTKTTGTVYKDILYLVSDLKKLGYSVYVANLSRSDTNIKTVRVLVPGLQPLDDSWSRVTKRLYELPQKLGQDNNVKWKETIFS